MEYPAIVVSLALPKPIAGDVDCNDPSNLIPSVGISNEFDFVIDALPEIDTGMLLTIELTK